MTKKTVADWDQINFDYPENIPTMISPEERRYLYWLGSRQWSGAGDIVEMGPWLGGSTVCLAAGMKASGFDTRSKLHVYDAFVWRDFMSDRSSHNLAAGESFESQFRENIREYNDLIVVNRATLPDEPVLNDSFADKTRHHQDEPGLPLAWTSGNPVEILFVDGAKSWSAFLTLLKTFGPHLVPDKSLLVFQDYKSWRSYWVPAIAEILSTNIRLLHVLRQNTVTFRVTSPIAVSALESVPDWDDLTGDECEKLIDRAAERLRQQSDELGAAIVRLSAVRMWMHKGNVSRAVERFQTSEKSWPLRSPGGNLKGARIWLKDEMSQELSESAKSILRDGLAASRDAVRKMIRRWRKPNDRTS